MKTLVLALLLSLPVVAQDGQPVAYRCVVNKVFDGDNIGTRCKIGRFTRQWNLRLIAIDAPEIRGRQPFTHESRNALRRLVSGHGVVIELRGSDTKWNRKLVRVYVQVNGSKVDVGLEQVRQGMAWYRGAYAQSLTSSERQDYETAQKNAQDGRLGLWADKRPISPADWRRGKRR